VAFTYIPAAVGAIGCLMLVRYLPSGRALVLTLLIAAIVAGMVWAGWSLKADLQRDLLTPTWFQGILDRMKFTEHRLLPNWWLSSGLLEAARDQWSESVLFLTLLISNALFLRQLAIWTAGGLFRAAYSRLQGSRSSDKLMFRAMEIAWAVLFVALGGWILAGAFNLVCRWALWRRNSRAEGHAAPADPGLVPPVAPAQMRLLIIKDLRLFRRDPVQWGQFLIFFGLFVLYFLNIRWFSYEVYYKGWVNMVSFLNVSVVGLLLSTFTTRFIFPMISLEARRFWILGLLPLKRETMLWSKFVFAAGGSILPCSFLILLSDLMLGVSPRLLASHQLTCVILCFGLSGIAVGMGARMPSLREQSPSRIAAGFGGTLNLVFSTLYILVIVLLTAVPVHFYLGSGGPESLLAYRPDLGTWLRFWLVAGTAASVALGVAATVVPLMIGFRAFRRIEF
jgi:ABC-2 type transport system permease protein